MHLQLQVVIVSAVVCVCLCAGSYIPKPSCSRPDTPRYGRISPRRYRYPLGSKVSFRCRYGYQLVGFGFTRCVLDSKTRAAVWNYASPVCKRETSYIMISAFFTTEDIILFNITSSYEMYSYVYMFWANLELAQS